MNVLEAILLGVVQGFTEFLPISSSGHLILVPWLADIRYLQEHSEFNKTFDVALHLGTLASVLVYFRTEVRMMVEGLIGFARHRAVTNDSERLALLIAVGTIPAVVAGGLGEHWIDRHLGEPWQIAILLAVFGLLLAFVDRRRMDDLQPPTRSRSASPRRSHSLPASRAQASRSPPGARSASTATPPLGSPSCSSSPRSKAPSCSRAPV
jgi:undecaprenyl-diphosphatase